MARLHQGSTLRCWLAATGCEPPLVMGAFECAPSEGGTTERNAHGVLNAGPVPAPWQTSFDDGLCRHELLAEFYCADPNASYRLVTSSIHAGPFAAAFDFKASAVGGARQARCERDAALPIEADYGAWYCAPRGLTVAHDGNLFHFQGGEAGPRLPGLSDVWTDDATDAPTAYVRDLTRGPRYDQSRPRRLPQDRWFHLEFYLGRATDETAEIALFPEGDEVLRNPGVGTDDVPFVQWYVDSFAGNVSPSLSTTSLYVDDVAVRLA